MSAALYQPLYLAVVSILCLSYAFRNLSSPDYRFQVVRSSILMPLLVSLVLIFWLGNRPISGYYFGDTANYALEYTGIFTEGEIDVNWGSEWIWKLIMATCREMGLNVNQFLTVIEAGYVLSSLWAIKKFVPTNPMIGILFVFSSLMFFSFATNGIRNGLACHIILLAMAFFFDDKYIIGAVLCLIAFGIHRSTMLPIIAMFAGRFLIKDYRYAIYFWIASIFISLIVGGFVSNFLGGLGFDDRMNTYNTNEYAEAFSSTGFRFDFLIYSMPPIVLGWYVLKKKKIRDDWYKALCISYCICNAFWVIVIRSAFSNRFAYLSWFMYPILIVYPLVNLPIWKDQDRKTGLILAAYCCFTLFMQAVFWGVA